MGKNILKLYTKIILMMHVSLQCEIGILVLVQMLQAVFFIRHFDRSLCKKVQVKMLLFYCACCHTIMFYMSTWKQTGKNVMFLCNTCTFLITWSHIYVKTSNTVCFIFYFTLIDEGLFVGLFVVAPRTDGVFWIEDETFQQVCFFKIHPEDLT